MGVAKEALEEDQEEVVSLCHCHRLGGSGDNDDHVRGEEQDMPYANTIRCPATGGGQRGERATSTTTPTTITSTGVSGIHVGWIMGMGNIGVHGAMATTTTRTRREERIPPCGRWQHSSWRHGCIPPAANRGTRGRCQ